MITLVAKYLDVSSNSMNYCLYNGRIFNVVNATTLYGLYSNGRIPAIKNIDTVTGKILFNRSTNEIPTYCINGELTSTVTILDVFIKNNKRVGVNILKFNTNPQGRISWSKERLSIVELKQYLSDNDYRLYNTSFKNGVLQIDEQQMFINNEQTETVKQEPQIQYTSADKFTYNITSNGAIITGLIDDSIATLSIPPTYRGVPIVAIGSKAFSGNCTIKKVIMGDNIQELGKEVFSGCKNLSSAKLSNNLSVIPAKAFKGCKCLSEVNIPRGVQTIGVSAFDGTSITKLDIPPTLRQISERAFSKTKITELYIPKTLEDIKPLAFSLCTKLEKIVIDKGAMDSPFWLDVFVGCKNVKMITLPNYEPGVLQRIFYFEASQDDREHKEDEYRLKFNIKRNFPILSNIQFYEPSMYCIQNNYVIHKGTGELMYYLGKIAGVIPTTVKKIGKYAFANLQFNKLVIPEGIEVIDDFAFCHCQVNNLVLPNSLKAIGEYTFYALQGLEELVIPDGVEMIDKYAFAYCEDLKRLVIGTGIKKICNFVFSDSKKLCEVSSKSTNRQIDMNLSAFGHTQWFESHLGSIRLGATVVNYDGNDIDKYYERRYRKALRM